MIAATGEYKLLVMCVYPQEWESWRSSRTNWKNGSATSFESLTPVETIMETMIEFADEVQRLSKGRFKFTEIAVSHWRPIECNPDPADWGDLVHKALGAATPVPYNAAFIIRPNQCGIARWDNSHSVYAFEPLCEAEFTSDIFNPTAPKVRIRSPLWALFVWMRTGIACQNAQCVIGNSWASPIDLCPDCRQKLGWV